MGGKSDAPPAPDYLGAAQATAAGDLENARATTKANRVNYSTPYGNLTYRQTDPGTFDEAGYNAALQKWQNTPETAVSTPGRWVTQEEGPESSSTVWVPGTSTPSRGAAPTREQFMSAGDPDSWSASVDLSPVGQQLLDQQNRTSLNLAGLQDSATQRVASTLNAASPDAYDPTKATNNAAALIKERLLPQQQRDRAALETQLSNQGLQRGTEAWNQALAELGRNQNDARQQAELAGINLGMQQQQQSYQQGFANRNAPLNELSALRTGSQVTNPTFGSSAQQQYTGGADVLGATNSQYNAALQAANAQNAQAGGLFGGLMGLGGLGLKAYGAGLFGGG